MPSVIYAEGREYAHSADHSAECHYAECRGTI
jgi:hypothetical protein